MTFDTQAVNYYNRPPGLAGLRNMECTESSYLGVLLPCSSHNHASANGEIWVANLVGVSRQEVANCTRQLQRRQPISYSWQWNYVHEWEPGKVYVLTEGRALSIGRRLPRSNFRYCPTRVGRDLAASLSQSARLAACPFTEIPVLFLGRKVSAMS